MHQLALFDDAAPAAGPGGGRGALDTSSEVLLARFRAARLGAGECARTVARDVSQLRALARASAAAGGPADLAALFADLHRLARALSAPPATVSRSTGQARLRAAQRYLGFAGTTEGRGGPAELVALDRLLPGRPVAGWHATGVLVAGTPARRRRRGPTLDIEDLARIVAAAGHDERPWQAARDRALVALHCYSGLRAEEVVRLDWEHLVRMVVPPGRASLCARVPRRDANIELPLLGPAIAAMEALARAEGGAIGTLTAGPVIRASGPSGRRLGYRAARDVLRAACRAAGLPVVETGDLRAACAYWLRSGGLSDHEVMAALGLAHVRSVDQLLSRHAAIDAQRQVRGVLDR